MSVPDPALPVGWCEHGDQTGLGCQSADTAVLPLYKGGAVSDHAFSCFLKHWQVLSTSLNRIQAVKPGTGMM